MNIAKIKQIFSLQNLSSYMQRTLRRFPVAVSFMLALTVLLSVLVIKEFSETPQWIPVLMYFLSIGTVLDFVITLWGEEQKNATLYYLVKGILLFLWAGYCTWIYFADIQSNVAFTTGNEAFITALILSLPFISYIREKNDLKAWHLTLDLCVGALGSMIVTGILEAGLNGLIFGSGALFEFTPNEKAVAIINIVCVLFLGGFLFLSLVPHGEHKHNTSLEIPRFLTGIVKWVFLPLLCCYMLVLYVYGAMILVKWELPKGLLSWLVSAVMACYVLCYIIIYPMMVDGPSTLRKIFTRWLPALILPLLVLMSVGVVRRFMDYGITAPRLYLLTVLIWFYAVCILIMALPHKRFHWIFFSFAALFLLSSAQPYNYYHIGKIAVHNKIEAMLEKGIPSLTQEEKMTLTQDITYLQTTYGKNEFEDVPLDELYAMMPESYEIKNTWLIDYIYGYHKVMNCPQGYSTFQYAELRPKYHPKEAFQNGQLNVTFEMPDNADATLSFTLDTAQLNSANKRDEHLLLQPKEGNAVIIPRYLKARRESNKDSIYVDFEGFLFLK